MAFKSRSKVKTFFGNKYNEATATEKARDRILRDFRKRLDSPHVRHLISMGNKWPKLEKNDKTSSNKSEKLTIETLCPPNVKNLTSTSQSEDNMDKNSGTVNKVHRRKTKSERNKARGIVNSKLHMGTSKKQKIEEPVLSSKEQSAFKRSVKSVERPAKKRVEKTKEKSTDKSMITSNRLTMGLGYGLFNREKKSGTALKDTHYVNSDLEIEVMPPEKSAKANFDIANMYGHLKKSKEKGSLSSAHNSFTRTPQSVHSAISLKSLGSSNGCMEVDDHTALSSESFPSSPDFDSIAAYIVTQEDIATKFPDHDLIAETKANLRQIRKIRNPIHDPSKDYLTPVTRKSACRGVSSEIVKRESMGRLSQTHLLSRASNSTSTTQLSVLAHKKGVEAMHLQYHNQCAGEQTAARRDSNIVPSRGNTANVKLNLARTRLAEDLDRQVWIHEQTRTQESPPQKDIKVKALTDAKALLEYNEHQTKAHDRSYDKDIKLRFMKDEHTPMDFLDSLSTMSREFNPEPVRTFRHTDTQGSNMDFEIFASTRDPYTSQDTARFEELYARRSTVISPVADQKVVTQFLPQSYSVDSNCFATTSHQAWKSPRKDFFDYNEESQNTESRSVSQLKSSQSPVWKPRVLHDSPSPQHFYPHKMF